MEVKIDYIDGLAIYQALASEMRLKIIQMLQGKESISFNEIAKSLNISNSTLTAHIKKLESSGIIKISNVSAAHGSMKQAQVVPDKLVINFSKSTIAEDNIYETELKVGHYSKCEAFPTCGLATPFQIVGALDDPRYFNHPARFDADLLWLTKGYVEYLIPNLVPADRKITAISISLEIASEAPKSNNHWPSDIQFFLDVYKIGTYLSPGDFGDKRGLNNPEWWHPSMNQYGLLKTITINSSGCYIDGTFTSPLVIDDLNLQNKNELLFRIAVDENSEHIGGLTIFGDNFGNYAQDIVIRMHYI